MDRTSSDQEALPLSLPSPSVSFHTESSKSLATQSVQDVTAASRTPAETQAGTRPRSVRSGCFGMRLYLLRLSRNSESDGEEGDSATCGWQHCQNMELALPSETGPEVGGGCNWRTCLRHGRVCGVWQWPPLPHTFPTPPSLCVCASLKSYS